MSAWIVHILKEFTVNYKPD